MSLISIAGGLGTRSQKYYFHWTSIGFFLVELVTSVVVEMMSLE